MRDYIEELGDLVAKELESDLISMDFEDFRKYRNSSIDCLRCLYGADILYKKLAKLDDVRWVLREKINELSMKFGTEDEVNKLKEELKEAESEEGATRIITFHHNLREFLGAALVYASDSYRQIILGYAKDKGLPPEDFEINLQEDYDLRPVIGENLDMKLYHKLQYNLSGVMPSIKETEKPKKKNIFVRPLFYLIRKLKR